MLFQDRWLRVDSAFIASRLSVNTMPELLKFFDGRPPEWGELADSFIPRRRIVFSLASELLNIPSSSHVGRLRLIHGASGEGKTTVAMQCAIELAQNSTNSLVLWRNSGRDIDEDEIRLLPKGRHYFIVSDDAEEIAGDLYRVVARVKRPDVTYVLAARTVDWANANGEAYPWMTHIGYKEISLKGLDEWDANLIVDAWSSLGKEGLGQLSDTDASKRVAAFLKAVRDESEVTEGTLLGGMLRVRYGDYLTDRIRALLVSLARRRVNKGRTLATAFLYVSAAHGAGLHLPPAVLADVLEISASRVMSEAIGPLRDEAAVTMAGGAILTRHRLIADACLSVASNANLPEIYAILVKAAMRVGRHEFIRGYELYPNLCRRFEHSNLTIAVATAKAAATAQPDDLGYIHNLTHVLRKADLTDEAAFTSEAASKRISTMRDRVLNSRERVFYLEWASAEGTLGNSGNNIWLSSISLSDIKDLPPPELGHIEIALASVGGKLATMNADGANEVLGRGVRAAEILGHTLKLSRKAESYFTRQRNLANRWGIPPFELEECCDFLKQAIVLGWSRRERELTHLPSGPSLSFQGMLTTLQVDCTVDISEDEVD